MYLWQDSIGRPMHWTDSIKNGRQIFVHCGGHHSNKGLKRPVFFCRDKCSYCFYTFADLNISESETSWQDVSSGTTGQCSGVSAWHSAHGEHDPGWRSAADADDLCHWGGFQGSALTTALTSLETHTHRHTHTHTRIRWTHQPCTRSEASVPIWPTLIILSLSNRWRGFPGCHLCRWPLFRDSIQDPGRAGWQHARSTSELSYHWHQVSRRCHVFILWEFNPPFRMDQALCRWREAVQISVAGHTVPSLGNVKRITLGIQACLIAAALLVIMKQ